MLRKHGVVNSQVRRILRRRLDRLPLVGATIANMALNMARPAVASSRLTAVKPSIREYGPRGIADCLVRGLCKSQRHVARCGL
jgi:hypothetical protein